MNESSQQPSNDNQIHTASASAKATPISEISRWQVIGKSVRGSSHIRTGKPNQDAILWGPPSGSGSQLILALSDGHGSASSFRSEYGAEFAVKACIAECSVLLRGQDEPLNLSAIKRTATEQLPQRIVRRWRELVHKHLHAHPYDIDTSANREANTAHVATTQQQSLLWYGATLLAVVVTDEFVVYLQLGDGEILTVSDSGTIHRPIPADERLYGNETTSLCSVNPWQEFRVVFQAHFQSAPALILLSTDGYINSFTDAGQFFKVGTDLLRMIQSAGLDAVEGMLERWLAEASEQGSGDDITLGIVCRTKESYGLAQTISNA